MSEKKKEEIISKLQNTRDKLLGYIENLDAEKLNNKVNDKWTSDEVIRHLMISENGMTKLIEMIKRGGEGVPEDFDINRYNKNSLNKLAIKSLEETVLQMKENRQNLLNLINNLADEDWEKKGRHASLRILTIKEILHVIADHETGHLNKLI